MARGHPDWGRQSARQRFSESVGATPYEQKITVAAGVTAGSPTSQNMDMEKGEVAFVQVRFPSGPAGLLGVSIHDEAGTTQLWPGGTGWFTGDNEVIDFDTEYKLAEDGSAFRCVIKGYNSDDTYPHAALVRLWVIPHPA